jgi:branched-chain amino acid transport system permease protein
MEILIYGTVNSIALALMALGFALVYGVSRVPNFAHGAIYVVSGFLTWTFLRVAGLNYFLSALLAILVTGLIGAFLYRFVLIRVRGMAISEIIASYAIGLAILEGCAGGGSKA